MVVATVALLLRQAGSPSWETVWAEDVRVFYIDALDVPLHEALLRPQAGYALLLPRLLAAVGAEMDAAWFAPWAAASSALVAALLALFVYLASAPLLRSPLRRAVLACSTMLIPVLPVEVASTICNLQWFFTLPCLLALLFPAYRIVPVAVRSVIAVVGPLSAPLAALLAPLALWQLGVGLRRKALARTLVVPVLYLLSSGLQVAIALTAEQQDPSSASMTAGDVALIYLSRVVGDMVLGVRVVDWLWSAWGWWLVAGASVAVAAVLVVKVVRGDRRSRTWVLCLTVASVAATFVQLLPRQAHVGEMLPSDAEYLYGGTRWTVLPALLLVMALLVPREVPRRLTVESPEERTSGLQQGSEIPKVAVSVNSHREERGLWRAVTGGYGWVWPVVAVVVWAAIALVPSYRLHNGRSSERVWYTEVEREREECEVDPQSIPRLLVPPRWEVKMTCEQLE